MENTKRGKGKKLSVKIRGILLSFCLVVTMLPLVFATAAETTDNRKLQNGSFEKHSVTTWNSGAYAQPDQSKVENWNTTAYNSTGTNGLIELFKENKSTYITGITLKPSDGVVAAELNADEESTLYQNVNTTPSSIYEWGLDHGGRTTMDTMALVIGPKQSVNPSKPSKAGRDQFMQMLDWLIAQGKTSVKSTQGLGEQLTVYSKKFAASGAFFDNAGNNAFSLTPSTIYTEEWHIWIMADGKATSGTNPWGHYGSNAEGTAGSDTGSGSKSVDLSKYYLYTVPAGQTETVFAFVSVGCKDNQGRTYGNFLDNINFQLYHPLSGSTTNHGSAVIGGSDGTAEGEGADSGHKVTIGGNLATYVTDGKPLKVQAIVKKADADDGCEFVGVYYTKQDKNGNPHTVFLQLAGNVIEDSGSLTDEEKKGKWIKSTNTDGDTIYTYYLENLTSATDLHFIFIKSPTVTYDPNGGKPYDVSKHYDIKDGEPVKNVYSFKPADDAVKTGTGFIEPYISHAAEGQNDGWKFMGWKLTGDTIPNVPNEIDKVNPEYLGDHILPAVHTVACNYYMDGASDITAAQYFKIYEKELDISDDITIVKNGEKVSYVQWGEKNTTKLDYGNVHRGLTMVAQWRWRQAFIPQVNSGSTYIDSAKGGTVEITSVTDTSNSNYNAAYNPNGGKSYHAETDEVITVKAIAKENFTFEGWYLFNKANNTYTLVTNNDTLSYTETKEGVNTYYALFSGSVTQTYIRQVKNGDSWENTSDDKIGILDRYTYSDAPGTNASSHATAGTGYKFVGWYYKDGETYKQVGSNMLINGGATISYTTTGNATYYARFETAYTVKFVAQTQYSESNVKTETKWGSVSPATVTDVAGAEAKSTATPVLSDGFLGWYDGPDAKANQLSREKDYTPTVTATNDVTYYARFAPGYTVNFVAQTKQADGTFLTNTLGGTVSMESATDLEGKTASSKATANSGYNFLGWYDKNGNQLSTDATYSTTTTSATNGVTYYARFALPYNPTVENKTYLSFVSEDGTNLPAQFNGRNAGGGMVGGEFGNTISTGFRYSVDNMENVTTLQITVTVPADSYVKVGGTGKFDGNGTDILTDSENVTYNKGSIQPISGVTTLTYYWDASGLQANTTYGFIIDNLYAPGATATITVNGTAGTEVTSSNGVVNTASGAYRGSSHYSN